MRLAPAISSRWPSARSGVGAAVEQLARLASAAGVAIEPPAESFPDTTEALVLLDREHRPFDVARILLWKAEAGESGAGSRAGRRDLRGARRASVPRTRAEAPDLGAGPPDEPPATGHFNSLLPIAEGLADAGHEVAICTTPAFAERVAEAGYEHLPGGAGYLRGAVR